MGVPASAKDATPYVLPSSVTCSSTRPASSRRSRCPSTSQTTSNGCSATVVAGHRSSAIANALARPRRSICDDAVAPALVVVEPLADELGVVGDVVAVAGVQADEWHRGRPPQALEVLDARPRAAAGRFERRVDLGVGGDPGQQMVTDERDPLALVDQQRVGRAVARTRHDAQVAAAGADRRAVGEHDVGVVGLRLGADEVPEVLGVGQHGVRHAVVAHQREREPPVGFTALVVLAAVGGRALVGRDAGARALGDRGREPAVVEMVVGDQDELDVLQADAGLARPASSAASASSSHGPVSISVSGSPRSSQALTEPMCGRGSGMRKGASIS